MRPLLLAMTLLMVSPLAGAGPVCWKLDTGRSSLTFTGRQAGAPAHGRFREFSAHLCFDPGRSRGQLQARVDLGSVDTRNDIRDRILRGHAFFDVARYPRAVYRARRFAAAGGPQRYRASGTLRLHGVSRPLPLTFSFRVVDHGRRAEARGEATIDRRAFDIGQGRWSNTRWVGARVQLRFDLHFTRAG